MREWIAKSKKLLLSIIGTIGVKGLSLIISLFTTSAYMHYFASQELLGVWLALVSMLNWIINFDLGIGNGLRNRLVEAINMRDSDMVRRCVSSAYTLIGVLSLAILFVGNILLGYINWNKLLNVSNTILSPDVIIIVVRITFSGIIIQFFLRLVISILYALQKPALANFISLLSHTLILLFVCLFRIDNVEKSMVILSLMQAITINIPLVIITVYVFKKIIPKENPNLKYFNWDLAKGILNLGYQFLWIQLALLIINSTNDFLITRIWGPNYVVEYQVYDKVFLMISSGFSLITVPIWSAVTKAKVEKRYKWITKTYQMLICMAGAVSLMAMCLPLFFQSIVNIWLGSKAIEVNLLYSYSFAIYNSILMINYASTSISNGLGELKVQLICNTFAAIVKIPLVFVMSRIAGEWISVVWVNILVMLPCLILQPLINGRSIKKMASQR